MLLATTATAGEDFVTADGTVRVKNWTYQLQGGNGTGGELRPNPVAAANHDMVVIDFARYADEESMFTPTEVQKMRESDPSWGGNGQRKILLSYISIGEASDYRSFWDPAWTDNGKANGNDTPLAPDWLGPMNPDWPDGRKVRYWDPDWQDIIYNDAGTGWLDLIVNQGFDGAYLDIVDAYYFWFEEGEKTELEASQLMIDFIVDFTEHARETNPHFLIFPQNGPGILDLVRSADPTRYAQYLNTIDAIAVEDTYFYGWRDMNNNYNPQQYIINWLKFDFQNNGVPVFNVDYVSQQSKIDTLYTQCLEDGFYPYAADSRELDGIGPIGPDVPDITLNVGNLNAGQNGSWVVTNALPNQDTYLAYSLTSSPVTYVPMLDIVLQLKAPTQAGSTNTTDASGSTSWSLPIPGNAAGKTVHFQVAQLDRTSNLVTKNIN